MVFSLIVCAVFQAPVGPHLPARTTPEIHSINVEVQRLISSGSFEEAKHKLGLWPGESFGYEVRNSAGSEFAERIDGIAKEAAEVWEKATSGRVKIGVGEVMVRLEFVKQAMPHELIPKWFEGKVVAKIPLHVGDPLRPTPRRSLVTAAAKAFGFALGHAHVQRHGWLMGVDDYVEASGTLGPSQMELDSIQEILDARKRLEEAIGRKEKITPAIPKLIIEPTQIDLGIVEEGAKPRADVVFRNSGNAPLEFAVDSTCRCLFLHALEPLAPGEIRVVRPGVDTTGLMGKMSKEFLIHSSDPSNPTQSLVLHFESVPEYRVVPEAMVRLPLADEGPTTFEVIVYSFPGKPLRVLAANPSLPNAKVEIVPFVGEVTDPAFSKEPIRRTGYKIRVTFESQFPSGSTFTNLNIETDSSTRPNYNLVFQTHKGIAAAPSSVYFGGIAANESVSRTFRVSHPFVRFNVLSASADGGNFQVTAERDDSEGFGHRITVTYNGGSNGPIVGRVIIRTDHPKYPEVIVPITGYTR